MTILSKVLSGDFDDAKRRLIKILTFGKTDVRESYEASPYGFDSCPIPGVVAVYTDTVSRGDDVIVGYIAPNKLARPGESRMYSTDTDGALKYFVHVKTNQIIIGTGTPANHMTQYEGLQTAFNELKGKFNSLVTAFNSHVHSGVTTGGGSSGIPASTATSSSADITAAKLSNILTN